MRLGEATNKTQLVQAAEETRKQRLVLRRPFETVWWNNLALLSGEHYAEWSELRGEFVQKPKDEHKVRLVLNHALTVARTELARITKSKPVMVVIPRSSDSDDISATKVGSYALDHAEWRFKLRKTRKNALWWMIGTGLGAVYCGYDSDNNEDGEHEFTIDPTTNEPTFHPDRIAEIREMGERGEINPEEYKDKFPLGNLEYKVFSPFQLLPDETALDWGELNNLITTEIVDVDVAKELWGRAARDLTPSTNPQLGIIQQRGLSITGGSAKTLSVENGTEIHTLWVKPGVYGGRLLPGGPMLRWGNNESILEFSEEFPFDDGRIPFAFFQHIPSATSIWPESIIQHIRGPNIEMDKTVSQLIEAKDYMANPLWLVAAQHQIKGEIKNVPGSKVIYVHVPNIPPPMPIPGTPMPAQVENMVIALRDQILDISGQGEVSRGRLPSGARSGVQVAYLQEEDETRIAPTIDEWENAIADMASMTLSRYSQFYTSERMLRIYKKAGQFDVFKFKGADLLNNTDVVVQAGSAMPKMKAAKQEFALQLAQLGLIPDKKQLMDILELGEGEPDDTDKAYAQADRENQSMVQGILTSSPGGMTMGENPEMPQLPPMNGGGGLDQLDPMAPTPDERNMESAMGGGVPAEEDLEAVDQGPQAVPVKKWHNHAAHLKRHYSFMMDETFDRLSTSHPEIVRLFDEHTAMHEQALAEQRQQEMMALQAAKGAPGPEGGVSPNPSGKPDVANAPQEATQGAME